MPIFCARGAAQATAIKLVWLMRLLIRLAVPAILVRRLSCQPLEFTMNRSA
jgi:hypothetical protein